ncbi:MAG: S-layer homology domain-containing protein [Ruminococcus sp.]|nr:S-layer homology domain-containing protein [Ruminococcus sp.]
MKLRKLLLCSITVAVLCAVLCTTAFAASNDYFNADITIQAEDRDLIVTINDSTVLREKKPSLKLAFYGDSASVLHDGKVDTASVENGYVIFQVNEGGAYIIAEGTYSVEITTAPGCTTEGEYTYTNSDGTRTYTESIPATGHDFSNIFRPTCANCCEPNPNYVPPYIPPVIVDPKPDEEPEPTPDSDPEPTPEPTPTPDPVPVVPVNPFNDVAERDYYYDAVLWAVSEGVTSGQTATTFAPLMDCTRAQVVTFLWRAAGCPKPVGAGNAFTDVESGSYYEKAVQWAVENGVTAGTTDTTFSPNMIVTRAQVVTFLWRAAGCPAVYGVNSFVDVPSDAYYADAVQCAVRNGITTGVGANLFSPDASCTRAQVVTFLYRYYAD